MEKLNHLWGILNQKIVKETFKNKIFPIKDASINILSFKAMLQKLPIALAQVKLGNTSDHC